MNINNTTIPFYLNQTLYFNQTAGIKLITIEWIIILKYVAYVNYNHSIQAGM